MERMYFSEVIMFKRTLGFMRIAIKKHGEQWVVGVEGKVRTRFKHDLRSDAI